MSSRLVAQSLRRAFAPGFALAVVLSPAAVVAMDLEANAGGLQRASANLHQFITSYPTPPVTPAFPVQQSLHLTPGSVFEVGSQLYQGGSGVAEQAFVGGPAVLAPDVVQPFLPDAWAAASARTGQLRAQMHGIWLEQTRSLPRPSGYTYQYDQLSAYGSASALIRNDWTFSVNRQAWLTSSAAGGYQFNPLKFGITLDVDTRLALNPLNAGVLFPAPTNPGFAALTVRVNVERLLTLDGSPRPDVLPDGSPSVLSYVYDYEFDASQQGHRTLRFEYDTRPALRWPAPPRTIWTPTTGLITGYQDGLPHSCLEGYAAGTAWGDACPVRITVDIAMSVSSTLNLAEASVSASWDASIGGGTAGIDRVVTSADQWGQALDPSLVLRPSLLAPVPEPGVWAMWMAGLGWVAWQRRAKRARSGAPPRAG